MRRSGVIPKVSIASIMLIVAIIISAPSFSVVFNRFLGGGTLDFNDFKTAEFRNNRPIKGDLNYIIGCTSEENDDDSGLSFKKGSYYYLVALGGEKPDKEKSTEVFFLKAESSADIYETLNDLWRASSGKDKKTQTVEISGVVKSAPDSAEDAFNEICTSNKLKNVTYVPYVVDCTKTVSAICARFYISLIFYAGFVIALLLSISAIKKNRSIDFIENERAVFTVAQKIKAGVNEDGQDAMFGDDERDVSTNQTAYQGQQASNQYQEPQYQPANNQYQQANNQYSGQQYQTTNNQYQGQYGQQRQSDDEFDDFFFGE